LAAFQFTKVELKPTKMKTILFLHGVRYCELVLLFFLFNLTTVIAQKTPIPKMSSSFPLPESDITQYDISQVARIGIGRDFSLAYQFYPQAKLHIREMWSTTPNFMCESKTGTEIFASIKHLFFLNDTNFATFQTGNTTINFFEGSLGTHSGLYFTGDNTKIDIFQTTPFFFNMASTTSSPVFRPLTLFREKKVKIEDTLECNNFLLHYNAGFGNVLVSDEIGNGNWLNPSILTDNFWIINDFSDMYSCPRRSHVGIGFEDRGEKIYQQLHIVDGNILLSRLHGGNPCSTNGSILFGDQVDDAHPNGKWGIEYFNQGLNFFKFYESGDSANIDTPGALDYRLFLKDDGTVGVGCSDTRGYKLAVYGNILCEEVLVRKYANWPDFVFDNDYNLTPLSELELFIKSNKHLPGMPTAKDVNENGLNLSKISAALLMKVEELTKYIIDQQKEIDSLKSAINNLK